MESVSYFLHDLWSRIVSFAPLLLLALIILLIAFVIGGWLAKMLQQNLNKRLDDPLLARFLAKTLKGVTIAVGLLLALDVMGLGGIAAGVLTGAGISAFVIGFAFKDIAENFLAGIILSFNRPFDMNDTISVDDYMGQVISLDFRTSKIKTFDGKDIYIPNAIILKQPVTNFTRDGLIRLEFVVGIDYDDDIRAAAGLITDTLMDIDGVLQDNPPYVIADQLATSTVNLRIFFWANTFDYKKTVNVLRGEVVQAVKEALLKEGFGLPADIQELKIYKSKDPFPVRLTGPSVDPQAFTEDDPQ